VSKVTCPERSYWRFGPMILALVVASPALVTAQSKFAINSVENTAMLKRAVVIVTTLDSEGTPLLQGSGFFLSSDLIATNMHVIRDAALIKIEMFDGVSRNVENVIAVNETDDLALLQLEAPEANVAVLQLADAAPVEGESILVLSNPRDSRWKLTRGKIGPSWQFKGTSKRIQITASIRPGSSGGPVVNQDGRVVGIAAMHMDSEDDLNFAVPVESLRALHSSTRLASVRRSGSTRQTLFPDQDFNKPF
jgi:S1-C subfamily serine protease